MPVEGTTTINGLDSAQPLQGDGVAEGDDHIRQEKVVLKNIFPGSTGNGFSVPITATEAELNTLDGLTASTAELNNTAGSTSAIQTQLDSITALIDGMTSVGSYHIGNNPNGILPGTWTQLAEGTFLMNTVASADTGGGNNNAALVSHTHTVNDPGHTHGMASTPSGVAGSSFNLDGTPTAGVRNATDSSVTGISLSTNGEGATGRNRPLYRGVEVWERTS